MEFPAYAVPDEVGQPPEAPAPEPSAPPSADASPESGAASPAPEPAGAPEMLPKYRYDEAVAARQAAEARLDQMARLVQTIVAGQGASPAPTVGLDPEEQARREAILGQLYEVMPELKALRDLAQYSGEIPQLIEFTRAQAERTQGSLQQYATYTLRKVADQIAPLVLGEKTPQGQPVTGAQLTAAQFGVVRQAFIEWVGETPEKRDRYDRGDESLRDEFVEHFQQQWVAPFRREGAGAVVQRQQKIAKLPVAGTSSAPVTSGPPKIDYNDEEAVLRRAWEDTQARLNAG